MCRLYCACRGGPGGGRKLQLRLLQRSDGGAAHDRRHHGDVPGRPRRVPGRRQDRRPRRRRRVNPRIHRRQRSQVQLII